MNEEELIIKRSVKHKIVFAFLMGIVTTGLVSFTVVLANLGLSEAFWQIWIKSWAIAYLVVIPVILLVSPVIERFVGFLFKRNIAFRKDKNKQENSNKEIK